LQVRTVAMSSNWLSNGGNVNSKTLRQIQGELSVVTPRTLCGAIFCDISLIYLPFKRQV
jgi:hypothetical protein